MEINKIISVGDQSKQDLKAASFRSDDLSYANFSGSDLRGADFTNADLTGADLSHSRTGIRPVNVIWIFIVALLVSLASGYFAMLVGRTIQLMITSKDTNVRTSGIVCTILFVVFIVYGMWKGGRNAILHLILPAAALALVAGLIFYFSGLGTGNGMFYMVLAFFLIVLMFIVGTVARAGAGALSNILFVVVALSGGMFGKSVGGGIGAVVMAISCAMVSKRALSGAKGFEFLRGIAEMITSKFGTSFRNARMRNANFSQARIRNADFSGADLASVNWEGSKKINCIVHGQMNGKDERGK